MKTTKTLELYPIKSKDYATICNLILEVLNTLINRTDGAHIEITRDDQFPPLNGKKLITEVKIKTWDIAA